MRTISRRWLGLGLALLALLGLCTACGLGSLSHGLPVALPASKGMPEEMPLEAPVGMAGAAPAFVADEALARAEIPAAADAVPAVTRKVIKTADLEVVVEDPRAAQEHVAAWVEAHGGYLVSSRISERVLPSGKRVLYGETTFRIPEDRFLDALDMLRSMAVRVEREDISGQDVTDEYVDLEARLRNLQAAEAELRRLLEQAQDTDQVLAVYRELMQVREQIEVLQGRLRYLQESVAFSKVEVTFIPVEADEPVQIGGWEPQGVARDAVRALIRTMQALGSALIWVGLYWLPVLLVVSILGWLALRTVRAVWRWVRR